MIYDFKISDFVKSTLQTGCKGTKIFAYMQVFL